MDLTDEDIEMMRQARQDATRAAGSSAPAGSALLIAFVQGAEWWEYHQTKATMWQSDRRLAEEEATRREQNGTLGVLPNARPHAEARSADSVQADVGGLNQEERP